jgi:hypothetical protein
VGFVVGGYCPGTSCVAAATGRIDGLVVVGGMMAGIWAFVELYPALEPFVNLTPRGEIYLPRRCRSTYGAIFLLVNGAALISFAVAERIEAHPKTKTLPLQHG